MTAASKVTQVGLIITTYNRPDYLLKCFASIKRADLSEISSLLIVDDASTDQRTLEIIRDFDIEGVELIKSYSEVNRGIKGSLLYGYNLYFENGYFLVINLDADAVVRKDFVDKIWDVKISYRELMVTGFNCSTLNKDGSVRHKILYHGDGVNFKRSVGGINLCIDKEQYYKWVKPALESSGNWDHNACLASAAESIPIACVQPSVIQHIGYESAMGHHLGGEPPDVADDFTEIPLIYAPDPNSIYSIFDCITLVGVDCIDINRLIKVADKACKEIKFGAVKLLSSLPSNDPRVIKIRPITSKEDYSQFMLKELVDYIDTSHLLIIQHDGVLENPKAWRDEWLEYDYIGAPWYFGDPLHPVGNGGFSLRTRRLHEISKKDHVIKPMNELGVNYHKEEDHVLCRIFGKYLQLHYGIKFAPIEEAKLFSIEAWQNPDPVYRGQFGYHGKGITFL